MKTLKGILEANNKRFDLFMDEYGPFLIEWLKQNKREKEDMLNRTHNVDFACMREMIDELLLSFPLNNQNSTKEAKQ